MAKDLRKKWYQIGSPYRSSFKTVCIWYMTLMCILFFNFGILAYEYTGRFVAISAGKFESITGFEIFSIAIVCLLLFLVGASSAILANRVFGPIYHLIKQMEEFSDTGEPKELKLRKGDYFQDVADSYNKMLNRFRNSQTRK